MGICGWIVFGFLAGLVGRALMPGAQPMGLIRTTLLGVGGSFAGGMIAALWSGRDPMVLHPTGFIGAVGGAIVLLVVGGLIFGRRR